MLRGTNLKYANSYNIRIVLEMIRLYGPIPRTDISRNTQLTAQTVTNIVKKLLQAGLIYESSRIQEGRGAPSIMLKINPKGAYSIGVDFDKDHLTSVLVDLNGTICNQLATSLDFPTPEQVMLLIEQHVNELIKLSNVNMEKIWGIGVGFPGPMIVMDGSVLVNGVNLKFFPGWESVSVVKNLEKRLQIPVYLENNASAAAIAERWYGAGKYINTFFYLFLGAGLGGGIIINGQLFAGHGGNAGELGYMPAMKGSRMIANPDGCHIGVNFSLPVLYEKLKRSGIEINKPEDLEPLFLQKNNIIMNWLEKAAEQLVFSVLSIEYLIDPEVIFFGGRLPKSIIKELIRLLEVALNEYRLPNLKKKPGLEIATSGKDAAVIGAAILPLYTSLTPILNFLKKKSGNETDSFPSDKQDYI